MNSKPFAPIRYTMFDPVFPQEIFDHIIEFVQDDHCTLATTSLVSSNWSRTSRRFLFRILILRPPTLEAFSSLVSNRPTFLPCVHHVILEDDDYHNYLRLDNQLLSWFPKLDHVKSLSIRALKWESTEVLNRFSSVLPSMTTLELWVDTLKCTESAKELLSAFSSLEMLVVACVFPYYHHNALECAVITRLPESDTPFLQNLKSLSFPKDCYPREFFIRNIPLGSLQLNEFEVYIQTMAEKSFFQNLILFMKNHCLNISSLQVAFNNDLDLDREISEAFETGKKLFIWCK